MVVEFNITTYLAATLGIVISIVLPMLKVLLPKPGTMRDGDYWPLMRPYIVIGIFSLLTALLIVAFLGTKSILWQEALLAGYAWDSTLQKVGT